MPNEPRKICIITGAGRGIGRAIALEFARQGFSIVACDVHLANAQSVAAETNGIALEVDVTSESVVNKMIATILERFGRIDVLINNAGIVSTGPLLETTVETWEKVHAVNLKGVFLCAKAVFPAMMAQRSGKIINIASVAGKRGGGFHGNTCYAASKGGVIALTKGLAREGGPYNINVNAIAPAMIETEMIANMSPEHREGIMKLIPLGRTGRVEDVAAAAVFLASDAANFMTGEIMDVDGGLMMD